MKDFVIYNAQKFYVKIEYEDDNIVGITLENEIPKNLGKGTDNTQKVFKQISEYLEGKRKYFDFKYKFTGTNFQNKVWKALINIPYGETRTYKQIASLVGNGKAYRAVGMANNKNPLMIIVPCHRVIGSDGGLTGYSGGLKTKQFLIELEKNNNKKG